MNINMNLKMIMNINRNKNTDMSMKLTFRFRNLNRKTIFWQEILVVFLHQRYSGDLVLRFLQVSEQSDSHMECRTKLYHCKKNVNMNMKMEETFRPIMARGWACFLRRANFFIRLHVGNKEKKIEYVRRKRGRWEEDEEKREKKHEHDRETNFQLYHYSSSLFSFSSLL